MKFVGHAPDVSYYDVDQMHESERKEYFVVVRDHHED
jgi:hypothetical protein